MSILYLSVEYLIPTTLYLIPTLGMVFVPFAIELTRPATSS